MIDQIQNNNINSEYEENEQKYNELNNTIKKLEKEKKEEILKIEKEKKEEIAKMKKTKSKIIEVGI